MSDEHESPMQRFEDLAKRLFHVAKEDVEQAERAAEEVVEDALGPPPAHGPAIADEGED